MDSAVPQLPAPRMQSRLGAVAEPAPEGVALGSFAALEPERVFLALE